MCSLFLCLEHVQSTDVIARGEFWLASETTHGALATPQINSTGGGKVSPRRRQHDGVEPYSDW
jgi:hypothetical protein